MLKNKTAFDTWVVTNEEEFKKNKEDLLSKKLPIMFSDDEDSYYDEVGGYHSCGIGWNPNGVWCGECGKLSCAGCPSEHYHLKTFAIVAKNNNYPEILTTIKTIDLQHARLEAFKKYSGYHEIEVWEITRRNNMSKVLIVIDMQNDFINGALGTKEAQAIVPNVKKKIEEYKARGDEIIFTRDTHSANYLETNEGKHLPVEHCIQGTYGWLVAEEVNYPEYRHINKRTFGYTLWGYEKDFEEVELVGLCTDICVVSNALILKAQFPEINVTVDASCCAGTTPANHIAALTTMKACQIDVIND